VARVASTGPEILRPALEPRTTQRRLVSLDVFRGATIAAMILVNDPGSSAVYWPLKHAQWNGWTPTDLIFPFFLFIVGVSLVLSFESRLKRGDSRRALVVHALRRSATIFAIGLLLSITLVYLILMAQFRSFLDPLIILTAIPPGLSGVVLILLLTHTTLNIMSLMGVIMMTGIVVSNSILIVEFSGILHERGMGLREATVEACKVRLRPILMTSLATLLGMLPMALGVEAGSEQYAPLARAIIGGLGISVVVTVFLVPAVYLIVHGRKQSSVSEVAS